MDPVALLADHQDRGPHGSQLLAVVDRHVANDLADRAGDADRVGVLPEHHREVAHPRLPAVAPADDALERLFLLERLEHLGGPVERRRVDQRNVERRRQQEHESIEPVGSLAEQVRDGAGPHRRSEGARRPEGVGDRVEVAGEVGEAVRAHARRARVSVPAEAEPHLRAGRERRERRELHARVGEAVGEHRDGLAAALGLDVQGRIGGLQLGHDRPSGRDGKPTMRRSLDPRCGPRRDAGGRLRRVVDDPRHLDEVVLRREVLADPPRPGRDGRGQREEDHAGREQDEARRGSAIPRPRRTTGSAPERCSRRCTRCRTGRTRARGNRRASPAA